MHMAFAQWTHDIRNALSTISLYVDALESPGDDQSRKTAASAQALLSRVAAMCGGVAQQLGEGGPPVARARFDLARTVVHVGELIAPILPASVSLQVESSGPVPVLADAQDAFRILFNLLHNAVTVARKTDALRTIRLALARTESAAVVTVSDDGPGLPEPVRARLFLGGGSSTGGSGQGLSIARALSERNGGTLRLADRSEGTTFVVELPLDPSAVDRVAMLYRARERRSPDPATPWLRDVA
jgi:signal transduction histidine kinase